MTSLGVLSFVVSLFRYLLIFKYHHCGSLVLRSTWVVMVGGHLFYFVIDKADDDQS